MKSLTEHLWFNTEKRVAFINITNKIEELVKKSGIKEGLCLVNAMHITASVFINDDEGIDTVVEVARKRSEISRHWCA